MNETLIYGIATLGAGVLGLLIRYCFKSKCSDVGVCFGLIKIKRDVEVEIELERRDENSNKEGENNI